MNNRPHAADHMTRTPHEYIRVTYNLHQPTVKNENNYKQYNNNYINHVIKTAKKKYYEEQLVKYKYDTRLLWKILNKIMSEHEKNRSSPKEFTENSFEGKISDPQTIKTIAYN